MPTTIQRVAALGALILLTPGLTLLALGVRISSRGPAIHRATRISRGKPFTLYKFRTMSAMGSDEGPGVTMSGDARVTPLGRVLRRTKLDELPQLWNVVRGDMLIVGPRPEDPRYIDWQDPLHQFVFGVRPGITGPAAIAFRHEEHLLASEARAVALGDGRTTVTDADLERAYRESVLPAKVALDAEYIRSRSLRGDLAIVGRTLRAIVGA